MTAVYTPADPRYFDARDLEAEEERVFDLCHGCRLCFNLCPSFGTLFNFIDAHDGEVSSMTLAERAQVVDECYQCKLCYVKCPYVPPHEWELDFPRLMMRVHANRHRAGQSVKERATEQFLGRTDLLGRVSTLAAPVVNRVTGARGSLARRVMEKTVGVASQRLLPPYAKQRFTTWFRRRHPHTSKLAAKGPSASIFPTCFIEYMAPDIGKDVVQVLEHNGVACSVPEGTQCCGAPWLHSGNVAEFEKAAERNVAALADEVRAGRDIVVSQPTCAYVLRRDYPLYVKGDEAQLVADHVRDPAEYLVGMHREGEHPLDLNFPGRETGAVPEEVTYHVPCHLQAQNIGLKSRDVLKLAGIKCHLVQRCSGIDGTWGYRATNYEMARRVAKPLAAEVTAGVEAAGNDVVCGDCHLANGAIEQETGKRSVHPMQVLARAYGLPEDPP
jgi:Fe-S oxidoreductase